MATGDPVAPSLSAASAARLRRAGVALVLVGLADLAGGAIVVAHGAGYATSLGPFAVAAGILLRRGSVKTAGIVGTYGALLAGLPLGFLLGLPAVGTRVLDAWGGFLRLQVDGRPAIAAAMLLVPLVLGGLACAVAELRRDDTWPSVASRWSPPWRTRAKRGRFVAAGAVMGLGMTAFVAARLRSEAARTAERVALSYIGAASRAVAIGFQSGSGGERWNVLVAGARSSAEFEVEWRADDASDAIVSPVRTLSR